MPQDKKIADIVMSLWASFAKTRNPTQQIQGGAVKWEPFTDQSPGVMVLDRNFSMTDSSTFDYKSFAFWNTYYPKVRRVRGLPATNELSYSFLAIRTMSPRLESEAAVF